jgi:hypothetical protein
MNPAESESYQAFHLSNFSAIIRYLKIKLITSHITRREAREESIENN